MKFKKKVAMSLAAMMTMSAFSVASAEEVNGG